MQNYMDREWLEPWEHISESDRAFFKKQLAKEITSLHPLYGLQLTPIGRNGANDDLLVTLSTEKFAVVHLTWGSSGDHFWPSTEFFDSWEEFVSIKMKEDNFGY